MNIQELKLASQDRVLQHTQTAIDFFRDVLDLDYAQATITDRSLLSHFGPFREALEPAEMALHGEWSELVVRLVEMTYGVKLSGVEVPLVDIFDLITRKAVH
jgi:hypothetical protein